MFANNMNSSTRLFVSNNSFVSTSTGASTGPVDSEDSMWIFTSGEARFKAPAAIRFAFNWMASRFKSRIPSVRVSVLDLSRVRARSAKWSKGKARAKKISLLVVLPLLSRLISESFFTSNNWFRKPNIDNIGILVQFLYKTHYSSALLPLPQARERVNSPKWQRKLNVRHRVVRNTDWYRVDEVTCRFVYRPNTP